MRFLILFFSIRSLFFLFKQLKTSTVTHLFHLPIQESVIIFLYELFILLPCWTRFEIFVLVGQLVPVLQWSLLQVDRERGRFIAQVQDDR